MKKTYIQPENTVVVLNARENLLQPSVNNVNGLTGFKKGADLTSGNTYESDGRENINTPDAWEEW